MIHSFHSSLFRAYDIRGTFGKTLFQEDAYAIGARFACYLRAQNRPPIVCVGRDGRLSSPLLYSFLVQGLQDYGGTVLETGIGPTPLVAFSVHEAKAQGGIMVTGSHNPVEDNGFKLMLLDRPLLGSDIQQMCQEALLSSLASRGTVENHSQHFRKAYVQRLFQEYQQKPQRPLKVAWDPGNGAAIPVLQELLPHLKGDHFVLHDQLDGSFPNRPSDPTHPKNLQALQQLVLNQNCDVGFAFDGDADRLVVMDPQGTCLTGDQTLALFAQEVLQHHPGACILADVKSSQCLFDFIDQQGGHGLITQTGHALIKKRLRETKALLAGEMSGHFFFADRYGGYDDGLYAAVRFLNILSALETPLPRLIACLFTLMATPEIRIPCPDEFKFEVIQWVQEQVKKEGLPHLALDGVRVSQGKGWWLLRASNTSPYLIARCEGVDTDHLQKLQNQLQAYLQGAPFPLGSLGRVY